MIQAIKFGTDGWRAIIADTYTVENVKRVSAATAKFILENGQDKVVIGHDCRFGGQLFAETTARVMAAHGIRVHLAKGFVSTPMVSLGVVKTKSFLGVVITASHNPPDYNGFKLKASFGGPSIPAEIARVEALIPDHYDEPLPSLEEMMDQGLLNYVDLESMYVEAVEAHFDMDAIRKSAHTMAYDAMYGAGQKVVKRLLPNINALHCDENPSFRGQAPEPISRNLGELSAFIKQHPSIMSGLANDGDADRIGMYDHNGNFVDSHHILLLLIHYLHHYKGLTGKVVVTFSVTDKVKKLCAHYGLPVEVKKIGFKYIAEVMITEQVLVGGEESGGIAVAGHIPERDGVWIGLLLFEFMAQTGKNLSELIDEVYAIVGPVALDRDDLHVTEDFKLSVMEHCKNRTYSQFGPYTVQRTEDLDGFKLYLNEDSWVMFRASGTEPVLRVYAQAPNLAEARVILEAAKAGIGYQSH